MKAATEDPEEFRRCITAFVKYGQRFDWEMRRRRKLVLMPGEGRFLITHVNHHWMGWQAAWDYLRS